MSSDCWAIFLEASSILSSSIASTTVLRLKKPLARLEKCSWVTHISITSVRFHNLLYHAAKETNFGQRKLTFFLLCTGISQQHMGITADDADTLLYMFRPTLFLHPGERSHPCSVEWYLPRTSLYLHCPEAPIKLLDRVTNPDTDLNSYYPYAGQRFHPRESRRFFLKQNADQPNTRFGEKENLDQVPYYGSCFRAPNGLICLTYFFFYAYNGPILQGSIVPNWIAQMAGVCPQLQRI